MLLRAVPEDRWLAEAADRFAALATWPPGRQAHPQATWAEIEAAVDAQLGPLLRPVSLLRDRAFPRDEAPARALTPTLQGHLSHLGSRLSFAEAASEFGHLKQVTAAPATARRRTETDGALYAAREDARTRGREDARTRGREDARTRGREDATTARLLATAPLPPAGPAVQPVSVDGTMVHLTDGSWRELRMFVIGTVGPGRQPGTHCTTHISYFACLTDAATFTDLAAGEIHRRSVVTAGVAAGEVDGVPWCQTFLDVHRPDAVRILDFPHAAQRLRDVAEAVWGKGRQRAPGRRHSGRHCTRGSSRGSGRDPGPAGGRQSGCRDGAAGPDRDPRLPGTTA